MKSAERADALDRARALSAHSLEEQIAVDVILGHMEGTPAPDAIVAVVDSTNLYQGLYLVQQLLDLERPLIVVLPKSKASKSMSTNWSVSSAAYPCARSLRRRDRASTGCGPS